MKLGALCVVAGLLPTPASAGASSQVGGTFVPPTLCGAGSFIQTASPADSYAVPFSGVFTSWSFEAGPTPPQLKVKAFRDAGGNTYTTVGESTVQAPAPSTPSTFPTRIPVQIGDLIGFRTTTSGQCVSGAASGYSEHFSAADVPPGVTGAYTGPIVNTRLAISAALEADLDGDGFGDESQDQCVGSPGQNNGCPDAAPGDSTPPDTTITDGPSGKTKSKTATVSFTGSDARAVASFQCRLDSGSFDVCSSPMTYSKLKKGSHTVEVRAVDAAGNIDPAPATRSWKVKKKKKKK